MVQSFLETKGESPGEESNATSIQSSQTPPSSYNVKSKGQAYRAASLPACWAGPCWGPDQQTWRTASWGPQRAGSRWREGGYQRMTSSVVYKEEKKGKRKEVQMWKWYWKYLTTCCFESKVHRKLHPLKPSLRWRLFIKCGFLPGSSYQSGDPDKLTALHLFNTLSQCQLTRGSSVRRLYHMTEAQPPGSWLTLEMTTSGREQVWKNSCTVSKNNRGPTIR